MVRRIRFRDLPIGGWFCLLDNSGLYIKVSDTAYRMFGDIVVSVVSPDTLVEADND